jgi:cytochrome P450
MAEHASKVGCPFAGMSVPWMRGSLPLVAHAPKVIWETWRAQGNLGEALLRILLRQGSLSLRAGLGRLRVTVTADPTLSRQILVKHADVCRKTAWERRVLFPVMGGGTIVLEDEEWDEHRRAIAPTFGAPAMRRLPALVSRAARSRLAQWSGSVNVSYEMRCMLNEVIVGYFLDDPFGEGWPLSVDDVAVRFASLEKGLEDRVLDRWGLSTRLRALSSRDPSFASSLSDVTALIRAAIERARTSTGEEPMSILRSILARLPPDDAVVREIRNLIAAGMTSVHLLTWLFHLLAKNPDVQEELRAAVDVEAPVNSLYVNAVINEGLRLYPPAPLILREGPEGLVYISIWAMHRHPRLWADPERFRPARFIESRPDGTERPVRSDAFIPFGAGPRVCIGKRFALIEAATILKEVLTRFRLSADGAPEPVAKVAVLTRPARDVRVDAERLV